MLLVDKSVFAVLARVHPFRDATLPDLSIMQLFASRANDAGRSTGESDRFRPLKPGAEIEKGVIWSAT
jgi:hypothetical protein